MAVVPFSRKRVEQRLAEVLAYEADLQARLKTASASDQRRIRHELMCVGGQVRILRQKLAALGHTAEAVGGAA